MTAPPVPPGLVRAVIGNAASLTGGRLLLALLRFLVALAIVQRAGLELFGQFALLLSFLLLAEWLSDFGTADVAVRQVSAEPARRRATLGAFATAKAAQGLVAAAAMAAAIWLLGHGEALGRAGLIAGAAVALHAAVQVYRVEFRADMRLGRDVGAELVGAMVLLGGAWAVTAGPASIEALALCYALSRAANLAAAALLAGGAPRLEFGPGSRGELPGLAAAAMPLGLAGLVVATYDAMDAIALSHWSTSTEVGIFSMATRIMMLALVAEQALATAAFPLLARQWARDREACARTVQAVLDWGMVAAGALFCALHVGALGLAELARQDPQAIAGVLRLLSWAVLARVVVTLIGPMVVIAGRMQYAVWIQAIIASAKWLALVAFAPQGAIGAATAYLVAEIGVGLLPAVLFCQRATGIRLRWSVTLRACACAAAVALAADHLALAGTLADGTVAVAAYLALATLAGAIRPAPLRQFIAILGARRDGDA